VWFSNNPSKAWGEKFFLLYTPYWIAGMALLMLSGAGGRWGDGPLNLAMLILAAPAVVVPALIRNESDLGRPWWRSYWFKFNLWMAVFAGTGSYFGSEYFFDVLGMVYDYPQLNWRLDSTLVGSGEQSVPTIMYTSAYFYFISYHTCALLVLRRFKTSALGRHRWLWPLAVCVCAYFFAWAETLAMTNGPIAEQFYYQDLPRMLRWGSAYYAAYFAISFPLVYRLDEGKDEDWTLSRTVLEALAASMLVLLALDIMTRYVGTIY
jgi:cycloeucalenol cycloisomerase